MTRLIDYLENNSSKDVFAFLFITYTRSRSDSSGPALNNAFTNMTSSTETLHIHLDDIYHPGDGQSLHDSNGDLN
jgi:hypothetical protein